jgi:hypothetical protein
MDRATAAAQLETLQADRAALADRAMQPWWYDVSLGLLVVVVVAQFSLRNEVGRPSCRSWRPRASSG